MSVRNVDHNLGGIAVLTKEEAVEQSIDKWKNIGEKVDELFHALHRTCALCGYHQACGKCPIGKVALGREEDMQNCADYFSIGDKLTEIRTLSNTVLENIKNIGMCDHADVDVTSGNDDSRFFICRKCGRHRTEAY